MMRSNGRPLGFARRRSATATSVVMVLVLVIVRAAPVAAQPSRPTGDSKALAERYAEAGVLAQKNGDYKTAIELYEKANALVPHPVFLYDIAQAHRLASASLHDSDPTVAAEHRDAARKYYREFVDTHPSEDLEIKAQGWLSKLDQQWAVEHTREEAARRADEDRKREAAIQAERARINAERKRQAAEQDRINAALRQQSIDAARKRARVFEIIGISAIGAGLAGSGLGIYYGVQAKKYSDRVNNVPTGGAYDSAAYSAGQTADQRMKIAYGIGAPLVLGGIVSLAYGIRSRPTDGPTVSVAPQVLPDRVGLVAIGHF